MDMGRRYKFLGVFIAFCLAGSVSAQNYEPHLSQQRCEMMAGYLLGNLTETNPEFNHQLIHLALLLDPNNVPAKRALEESAKGLILKDLPQYDGAKTADYLKASAKSIEKIEDTKVTALAALLYEVGSRIEKNGEYQLNSGETFGSIGLPKADWSFAPAWQAPAAKSPATGSVKLEPKEKSEELPSIGILAVKDSEKGMMGSTLKVSLNVRPLNPGETGLLFTGELGQTFLASAHLARMLATQHLSKGRDQTFEFKIKPEVPIDGGSAGAAMGLLARAAFEGFGLEPDLSVTGALNPNGRIAVVGGVRHKINAINSLNSTGKMAVIPLENAPEVEDLVLLDKVETLWKVQVFTCITLDELVGLARTDRAENLQKAMDAFEQAKKAHSRAQEHRNPETIRYLDETLRLAPNHLSAACLKRKLTQVSPRQYSEATSIELMEPLVRDFLKLTLLTLHYRAVDRDRIAALDERIAKLMDKSHPRTLAWGSEMRILLSEMGKLTNSENFVERLKAMVVRLETMIALIDSSVKQRVTLSIQDSVRQ